MINYNFKDHYPIFLALFMEMFSEKKSEKLEYILFSLDLSNLEVEKFTELFRSFR